MGTALRAAPGAVDHQRDAWIAFRHGHVNAMGGNLLVRRLDLSLDTHLGTLELGAVYNSARGVWRWSFESHYGSVFFTDPSGAEHDVSQVADGEAIAGTTWVKLDAHRMKTKAGRVHVFGPTRWLASIHRGQAEFPRIEHVFGATPAGARVRAIRQCTAPGECSALYELDWNAEGQLTAVEDRAGRRAEFVWQGQRLVQARDGLDVAEGRPGFRYEYAGGGRLTAITTGEGERTEIGYDGERVAELRRIGEGNPTDSFHYSQDLQTSGGGPEAQGLYVTRHWDALGNERVYTYDAQRRLHEIWNVAVDERVHWTWAGLRPSSRSEPDGTTRTFSFVDDELAIETTPSGNVIRTHYALDGVDPEEAPHRPILRREDSLGLIEEHAYDPAGRRVATTNGAGETTGFDYDEIGHLTRIVRPSGVAIWLILFGESGHADRVGPDGDFYFANRRSFDAVGNRTEGGPLGEPAPGGVVRRHYDADRNVRSVELEDGGAIEIDVRSDGQVTRIARPGGDDHEMGFDALGRLVSRRERVDGLWQETRLEYDALDRQTAVSRANGMRQEADYDAAGRIVALRNLRHAALEGVRTFVYQAGRLVSSTDSLRGGTEYATYDWAGRLVLLQHADGRFTGSTHDARSRQIAEWYADADWHLMRRVRFGYDGAGRQTSIRDGMTSVLEREYEGGRLARVRYGNGLVRSFAWDPEVEMLQGSETLAPDGTLVESTVLARSLAWPRVVFEAATTTAGGIEATTRETYTLVGFAGESTLVNRPRIDRFSGSAETEGPRSFSFDGRSNLLAEGGAVFTFNEEGNRLLSIDPAAGSSLAYAYDEAGFATVRGERSIAWTADGRIASHGPDHFEWDVAGQPISSTVSGVTTRSLHGGAVAADEFGTPIRIDLGEVSIELAQSDRRYRHLDFRGNVKFTTDEGGVVESHYEYSPFGLEAVHGSDEDPVRFVMRSEIGELMQLGARIYDPLAGRFLSPDPIFQAINQYAYTLGNPISFQDRDGTQPVLGQLGIGLDVASIAEGLIAFGELLVAIGKWFTWKGLSELGTVLSALGQLLIAIGNMLGSWGMNERWRRDPEDAAPEPCIAPGCPHARGLRRVLAARAGPKPAWPEPRGALA
jgi:RHS repeat-associated protein